jgi:Holliday junction resolvase
MREEALQREIVYLLRARGYPAWLTHDSRHHPVEPGIADINAVLDGGRFLAIEVKAPGREKAHADRRAVQDAWLTAIGIRGGVVWKVSSLEEVIQTLSLLTL